MDANRFDALTRSLSGGTSRRRLFGGLAAGALGALVGRPTGAACPPDQVSRRGMGCVCKATGRPPQGTSGCPCAPGLTRCNGVCTRTSDDPANCGCNGPCAAGEQCCDGTCAACCNESDCPAPSQCTVAVCQGGVCGEQPLDCTHLDGPCVLGACDPGQNTCSTKTRANDEPCGDPSDPCRPLLCRGGVCQEVLLTDGATCGDPLDACRVQQCQAGVCQIVVLNGQPCGAGLVCCDGNCTTPIQDSCCGVAGQACSSGGVCRPSDFIERDEYFCCTDVCVGSNPFFDFQQCCGPDAACHHLEYPIPGSTTVVEAGCCPTGQDGCSDFDSLAFTCCATGETCGGISYLGSARYGCCPVGQEFCYSIVTDRPLCCPAGETCVPPASGFTVPLGCCPIGATGCPYRQNAQDAFDCCTSTERCDAALGCVAAS